MNMAEAKKKLMELAARVNQSNPAYHCMEYKIDDHGNGNVSQTCKVYISGHGHFEAPFWEHALQALEDSINGKPLISEDISVSSKRQ